MRRKFKKKEEPIFYYRVEHPSLRFVPIGKAEFERILLGVGYGREGLPK